MTLRPTALTVHANVNSYTIAVAEELDSGWWSLRIGERPATLMLLGTRDDLRGLLHRALGELAPAPSLDEFISDCVSDCVEGR